MKESQKKPDVTISGLVRRDLKEMEDQRFGGRSREQVWEWFCQKHGLTLGKRTFYNLFYRARERAEQEQMKAARLAMLSVQQTPPVVPEPSTQKKPKKEKKETKSEQQPAPKQEDDMLSDWQAHQAAVESADPLEMIKTLQKEGKIQL